MLLEVDHLDAGYRRLQVLHQVSLSVDPGELVALVGSNGAGKSTLLKAVSGILPVTGGTISFDGTRLDGRKGHEIVRLGVAHVPEGRRLFSRLSVSQNLLLGGWTRRRGGSPELERIYRLFPVLEKRANQLVKTMSGGEQQMVAVGRALMSQPRILMLDEPSLGLAPSLVAVLLGLIQRLRDEGIGVLLVEQKLGDVLRIADRGYVIQNGRVVFEGSGTEMSRSEMVRKAYMGV